MNLQTQKDFEKPKPGMVLGTIIDVVDMPQVPTAFGLKDKVRVLWVLAYTNNQPALDSEGKPLTVAGFYNATLSENSSLTKAIKQITSAAPPLLTTTEEVAKLLIGRSNQLFLVEADNPKNPASPYINVAGIAPLTAGQIPPQAPVGFVREKDKPAKPAFQQRTAAATAQAQTTPVNQATNVAPAPPTNNVAF